MKINKILLFLLIVGLASCYNSVEGCLDPESTNYSIEGDDDCDDCCKYPTIKLSVYHLNEDTTFNFEDTLVNNFGQEYNIIDFVYLLSDFKVTTDDDITYEVSDSVSLDVADGIEYVKDDVIRVRRKTFSYEFGTVIFEGQGGQLSFKLGLPEKLNENRFTSEISGHPLTADSDSLFIEDVGQYVFQRLKIAQGENFKDTLIYDVKGNENVIDFSFEVDFLSERGKNKTIEIEARYNKWFEDVDFDTMTKEEIEQSLVEKSKLLFEGRLE